MKDLKYRVKRLQKRALHYKESDPSGKELRAFSKDYLAVRRAIEKLSSDLANAYRIYEEHYNRWFIKQQEEQQSNADDYFKRSQMEIEF